MKILFLTDNFPPEINAPANRTYEHCREWVKRGAEVTVITCAPNFPKGTVFEGYKNKLYQKEEIDGIQVIRVWSYISANSGTIRRILDYLSFGFSAFWAGLFQKTDLIIGTSPQFFTAVAAWHLSVFKGKKWVMEVRDLWPESIIAVGAMSNKMVISILEWMELKMYQSASKVVVVTDTFKEKIKDKGISPKKIKVYKNGVVLDNYKPAPKSAELVHKYNLKGKKVISYIGTHGMAHGLDFILDCAKELQLIRPEFVFMFVGDGAQKSELMEKAGKESITNVIFVDSVPKEAVLDYLNLMDVALVNLKKSDTFKTVIPSKIFEAAAVEKPILLGLEGETQGMIETYRAGEVFEPENMDSFMRALEKLCGFESDLSLYIEGCRKLAWDFQRKKIADRLLEELKLV